MALHQRQEDLAFLLKMVSAKPMGGAAANVNTDRELVLSGLPHCFASSKDARHAFQTEFASLARGYLEKLEHTAAEQVAAADTNEAEAKQELDTALAEIIQINNGLEASNADVAEKKVEHEKAHDLLKNAQRQMKDAETELDVIKDQMDTIRADSAKACSALEGPFLMLKEGGWGDEEMLDGCVQAITDHFEERGKVEPTLLAATPVALRTQPSERGDFDNFVIESLTNIFNEDAESAAARLAQGAPDEAQASAEARGFWALAEVLCSRAQESAAVLAEAEKASNDAGSSHENAKRKATECETLLASRSNKKVGRVSYRDHVSSALASYERLMLDEYVEEVPVAPAAEASTPVEEAASDDVHVKDAQVVDVVAAKTADVEADALRSSELGA